MFRYAILWLLQTHCSSLKKSLGEGGEGIAQILLPMISYDMLRRQYDNKKVKFFYAHLVSRSNSFS